MKKTEIAKLLQTISHFYPNNFRIKPEDMTEAIDDWFFMLNDEDSAKIARNLKEHIKNKHYPPTIADLLKKRVTGERAIPGIEETRKMLDEWKNVIPATKEEREREFVKIRAIFEEEK